MIGFPHPFSKILISIQSLNCNTALLIILKACDRMVCTAALCATCKVMSSNLHQCLWTHDLQVHGPKRVSYHAVLCIVSRCCTRGQSVDHYRQERMQADILRQTSSKVQNRGISGPIKRICILQKDIIISSISREDPEGHGDSVF